MRRKRSVRGLRVLALACLGSSAAAAFADQVVSYQVQPGDTLTDVATQFGVTPGTIIADNALPATSQLPIGQAFSHETKEFAAHDGYLFGDEQEQYYVRLRVGIDF